MIAERKYVLTRLGPGDYLMPSNDGKVLWRIYTYEEDGTAAYIVNDNDGREREVKIKGTFWACARWQVDGRPGMPRHLTAEPGEAEDLLDWMNWETWASTLRTRRAAIDEALR